MVGGEKKERDGKRKQKSKLRAGEGQGGPTPWTPCSCYRYLGLFRELSKTQRNSVGLAFRTYATNCLGEQLGNFTRKLSSQEIDSLTRGSKVWCSGANFQKAFPIVKIFLLIMAVKTCENSNSRHL